MLRFLLILSTILMIPSWVCAQQDSPWRPVETQEQRAARVYEEALMLWLYSPDQAKPRLQRVLQITSPGSDLYQLARQLLRVGSAE